MQDFNSPEDVTVKIGDKVTDVQGNEYLVSGVQNYENNDDVVNSLEIIMVKKYEV